MTWGAILGLSAGAYVMKLVGVVLLPRVPAVQRLMPLVALLPPALLMALVVVNTVGEGRTVVLDERLVGLAVAGLLVWRERSFVVVVGASAAITALLRALG